MSTRSYSKIWLHLIWGTKNRAKLLADRNFRKKVSEHLTTNAREKGIYMKANYVNSDHIHALINLPTNKTVEDVVRLLKGELSAWINNNVAYKFNWSIGYAVFSVSESNVDKVVKYIKNQEDRHRKKSFQEEFTAFLEAYKIEKQLNR